MTSKFGSITSGLGDILLLTSICKYFPNKFTIQIKKDQERFKILFDGLALNVEITENIQYIPEVGSGHYALRKLRHFFNEKAEYLDFRPLVLYSDIESEEWAHNFLSKYNNPIIFTPHCSPHHANSRNIPRNISEQIIDQSLKNNLTPIISQNSKNKLEIDYEHQIFDLDLKKYICLLRKAGGYIGANTGDMHLAIATQCQCTIFQPANSDKFNPSEWNYPHQIIKYYQW
jgi:ADP-heptose:LPS heptosyltransferase